MAAPPFPDNMFVTDTRNMPFCYVPHFTRGGAYLPNLGYCRGINYELELRNSMLTNWSRIDSNMGSLGYRAWRYLGKNFAGNFPSEPRATWAELTAGAGVAANGFTIAILCQLYGVNLPIATGLPDGISIAKLPTHTVHLGREVSTMKLTYTTNGFNSHTIIGTTTINNVNGGFYYILAGLSVDGTTSYILCRDVFTNEVLAARSQQAATPFTLRTISGVTPGADFFNDNVDCVSMATYDKFIPYHEAVPMLWRPWQFAATNEQVVVGPVGSANAAIWHQQY